MVRENYSFELTLITKPYRYKQRSIIYIYLTFATTKIQNDYGN